MSILPFAFARDEQVAVEGGVMLLGPRASMPGLREARRRCGPVLRVERLEAEAFAVRLAALYQTGSATDEGEEALAFDLEEREGKAGPRDLLEDAAEAPVIQLVNQLLRRAVRSGASDLHVEPHEGGLRARLRIDGMLQTALDRADVPVRRVVSRLKVMAGLDIAETRLPQDGRIALRLGGRAIDVRVSTLPGNYGERVVMRLLDRSAGLMPLDALGLRPDQEEMLQRLAARPNGIILATGPTGSGKTTTLYSLLRLANREERNIVTVEDPIEYDLPGVSQSQINAEIGMTFAAGLRATLRQDPDIILVGEVRDGETASVAAQAALTGHLVFSSLHANGSVGAVIRLRDLGLDDFLIAATLRGIVAQRLLRRLCPHCARSARPTPDEAAAFVAAGLPVPGLLHHATGCSQCFDTGYAGRVGVFEIVEIGETVRAAIDKGASEQVGGACSYPRSNPPWRGAAPRRCGRDEPRRGAACRRRPDVRAYSYVAYTAGGRRRRGTMVAESEAQASRMLRAQGLFASEITPKGATAARGRLWHRRGHRRLSADMRAVFTRQMAVLLAADLPAEMALETLRAGETSGDVATVFEGLAEHLENVRSDKAQLATALIYPGFVAAVAFLVAGVLLTNVAPEITAMFEVTGRPLPRLTRIVIAVADRIGAHWPWLAGGSAAAQYLRTLALVIASRQTVVDAVTSAAEVLVIRRHRDEAAALAQAVRSGESLAQGLARMSLVPPVCRQLILAGEQSAQLARMTERAAALVETWLTNERKRLAAILDPLLMIMAGTLVLVIVLAILLPIFDLQAVVSGS